MAKIQRQRIEAPNKASANPRRPGHPVPSLIGPWLQFDLAAETEKLRQEDTWETSSKNAKTLAKYADLRVVLIAMKSKTRMEGHKADGSISIQGLTSRLRLHLPHQTMEVPAGCLLILERAERQSPDASSQLSCPS